MKTKLQGDNLFYVNSKFASIGSEMRLAETEKGMPDIIPTQEANSDNKDNAQGFENQANSKNSATQTMRLSNNPFKLIIKLW